MTSAPKSAAASEEASEDQMQRIPSADAKLDGPLFRRKLMGWYKSHARELPWRGVSDPYRTWLSEVMLQQTRVAAVIDHYESFLRKFPTMLALALAPESEVLATWSGLGYYRRARLLHKTAQFLTRERGGVLPSTSAELRTLPGIGEYTSAAIASIAFGESVAVVDGNVERVLLRLTGRPEVKTAAARAFVQKKASALIPKRQRWRRNQRGRRSQSGDDGARRDPVSAEGSSLSALSGLLHVQDTWRARHTAARGAAQPAGGVSAEPAQARHGHGGAARAARRRGQPDARDVRASTAAARRCPGTRAFAAAASCDHEYELLRPGLCRAWPGGQWVAPRCPGSEE